MMYGASIVARIWAGERTHPVIGSWSVVHQSFMLSYHCPGSSALK